MPRLPYAKPDELKLNPLQIERAAALLRDWTSGKNPAMPGAAILLGRKGKVVEPLFFGRQGPEADAEAISREGMFLMASITKPITYLGAMLLVERGQLNLSDPVARHIPDFASHHKEDTLVQHLFTHTSGLPDMLPNNAELRQAHAPLSAFIEGAIHCVPLFPAGTQLSYQSMGTLTVAEIIQRITKSTIHEFLKAEIFDKLGLKSIGLGSRGLPRSRLVRVELPPDAAATDWHWNSGYWQEFGAPWGGMFAAPEDFAVLCQLLLSGGEYDGVRLLAPETVRTMTTNRLLDFPNLPENVARTQPWGLGWKLNHRGMPDSWGHSLGPNVFGHSGSTGTLAWIDPDRDGFCLIMTSAPFGKHPWRFAHLSNVLGAAFV